MAEIVAETERLRLREWADEDEARFYEVMNHPPVMQHLGGVQSPEQWRAAYQRIRGFQREFGHTFWIIEDRTDGDILGFCGIKRVNTPGAGELTGQHEIGWRLRESAWGKGVAKEGAIASFDLAFGPFKAPHAIALTVASNLPSQRLIGRLGMTRREDFDFVDNRFGPELNPTLVWRIEAADWPKARETALRLR